MKSRISLFLILSLLGVLPVSAQSLNEKPREFKEFIEPFPKSDLLKLRGNQKAEAALELSTKLASKEVNKTGVFKLKVSKVEPRIYPAQKEPGWRVMHAKEIVKEGSLSIEVGLWAYVRQDPNGVLAKIRPGKEIIFTGKISRADISSTDRVMLHLDIDVIELKAAE